VYLEEYPINLLHELPDRTGHNVKDLSLIVIMLEYGKDFSGPGNDVFRHDRAVVAPEKAHMSNFLHPVFYYYEKLPTGSAAPLPSSLLLDTRSSIEYRVLNT